MIRKMIVVFLLLTACGSSKKVNDPQNFATMKGIITVWAEWVKDKGRRVDSEFHIRNDSDKFIIVLFHDMTCSKGDRTGTLKYTFFNTGERTIDLGPGQTKSANMVCNFPASVKGPLKVSISKVFENPSKDRATPGKLVASDVIWMQKDAP